MRLTDRRWWWSLPVLAAMQLAGCGMQEYREQPLQPQQWLQAYGQRSLEDPGLREFLPACGLLPQPWPRSSWDGPSLQCAAVYFHPSLARARAGIEVARAQQQTAGQRPNPTARIDIEHHGGSPQAGAPWGVGPSFEIPIELGGRREARIERAIAETTAAEIDLDAQVWQVRQAVRTRMLALTDADRQVAQLGEQLEGLGDGVGLLRRREEMGLASSFEASSMRIEAQRARLALGAARARQRTARAELAASISLPPAALDDLAIDTTAIQAGPDAELPPPEQLQQLALTGRADIRRALQEYVIAEKALKEEIARQYPDFTLSPGYFFDPTDNINIWTFGASLVLPVLNRNQGPIAEAQARRELAARNVESVQAAIIGELHSALAGFSELQQSTAQADEVIDEMQQQERRVEQQFNLGEVDRLALVRARLESASARSLLGEMRAEQWRALLRVENALQRVLPVGAGKGAGQ